MNILYEFVTVSVKTGAGEYSRRVFFELMNSLENDKDDNLHVYVLYDSQKGIAYDDLNERNLLKKYNVTFVDCYGRDLNTIVWNHNIDVFFIACIQYLRDYSGIQAIDCKVISVIHDLTLTEIIHNRISVYANLLFFESDDKNRFPFLIGRICRYISSIKKAMIHYILSGNWSLEKSICDKTKVLLDVFFHKSNIVLIAVSEYTKVSCSYFFNSDNIKVLYSPERIIEGSVHVKNCRLADILSKRLKFYLIVSAARAMKNARKAINAFEKFVKTHPDSYLVTIGFGKNLFDHHIDIDFLCDSDLEIVYKSCYALIYPSFFEGFGYPPVECMHYGKPILSSNVSSMPDVLGDAPIYFCPFYESSIYNALLTLTEENYQSISIKSQKQYNIIKKRQSSDLKILINLIKGDCS